MKAVLIPGDGIGREIAESVREVSAALNTGIEWQEFAAGAEYAAESGELIAPGTLDAIEACGWALKGPTATPIGKGFRSINVQLRQRFSTYANLRPVHTLPDPASLGPRTKGKTNIGCIFTGKKDGKDKTYYIYNVCDHQECYREVGSQAISYTTGVPAMCGALMMLTGEWTKPGVYTVEEFNPDPFLDALDKYGLPRSENHDPVLVD